MSTYNKVILVGHLGSDPIIRTIENNVKVADFSIATNEVYQKDGEPRETSDWHEIVAWRKLADFTDNYLKKGSKIMVEGKLKTSAWTDKETGAKRKSVFVLADQIRFMDRKEDGVAQGSFDLSSQSDADGMEDEDDDTMPVSAEEISIELKNKPAKKAFRNVNLPF